VKRLLHPLAVALGACAGIACRQAPPPAVRGVLLVLAPALPSGREAARLPEWSRLRASGRGFDAAFAPDPDAARARAALLGAGGSSLAALLRARGVGLAGLGDAAALPVGPALLDLSLPAGLDNATAPARLEAWLRERRGRFVVLAAVGGAPAAVAGAGPPATLAGAHARELPRIASADLGFGAASGRTVAPPAWSAPARQRAEAALLERALAADRELARLAELVERAAPGTAVVVVGDPEPDRGAHGLLERTDGLFEDTLRAALAVRTPGLARPGRASQGLVSTLDVGATLVELLGLPAATVPDARSLMPLLADPGGRARGEVLSSVPRRAGRLGRSLRTPRYRYTEWPDGSRELYDHDSDPAEVTNLAERAGHERGIAELAGQLASRAAAPSPSPVSARPSSARPRNVLLIVVDDLNTRIGAWGAPVKTPAIDGLAARGVRFEHAYVQVAMCSPSRASMLTGWRPERTGVWQNEDPPRPPRALPLQELFAAHGARTISIGKIYHSPGDFRWDVREEHPEVVEERDPEAAGERSSGLWVKAPGGDLDQPDGRRARRAAQLVSQGGSRPWFLALGLVRPHVRWVAPERYFGLYPPESLAPVPYPADDLADVPAIAVKTQPQPLPGLPLLGREPPGLVADPSFRRQATLAYQACVSFADAQVGVVLDALDKSGGFEDTVVVLVGDNGFHLGEHGGLLRKDTLFEEALHVPLVVAAPGLPRAGAVVKAPVELLDVYPTILELAGLEAPDGLDGESLVPRLRDPDAPGRGMAVSYRRVRPPERGWSLRTERQRYTLWPDGSEELYDCPCTPESENRAAAAERATDARALRSRLAELVAGATKAR
jgi:arylsulfatase A-like enzyme